MAAAAPEAEDLQNNLGVMAEEVSFLDDLADQLDDSGQLVKRRGGYNFTGLHSEGVGGPLLGRLFPPLSRQGMLRAELHAPP